MKRLLLILFLFSFWLPQAHAGPILMTLPSQALSPTDSPTFAGATINGTLAMGANAIQFTDAALVNKGTNILGLANSTNAQAFQVYNTDPAANKEWVELSFQVAANQAVLRTNKASSGTARSLRIDGGASAFTAFTIGAATNGGIIASSGSLSNAATLGRIDIGNNATNTSTSGTSINTRIRENFAPTASSTMVARALSIEPTCNWQAAGAGTCSGLVIAATETALPTGKSYAAQMLGGSAATQHLFGVTVTDPHIETGQATAPSLAAGCGTGATIVGTDTSGRITTNASGFTTCVITFHTAWTNTPQCFIADETTALSTEKPVPTTTTLTFVGTGITGGDVLSYGCFGRV